MTASSRVTYTEHHYTECLTPGPGCEKWRYYTSGRAEIVSEVCDRCCGGIVEDWRSMAEDALRAAEANEMAARSVEEGTRVDIQHVGEDDQMMFWDDPPAS